MKRCTKCGEVRPTSEFYKAAGTRDGRRNDCKPCNLAAQAARNRLDPDANRERARLWRSANPDRVAEKQRAYTAAGRKRISDRKSYLKRKFGLTPEQYDAMLAAQGGVCHLCGRPPNESVALHVDHDHSTGQIRGILCFKCNNALGDFDDDPDRLMAAAMYLISAAHDFTVGVRATFHSGDEGQLSFLGADGPPPCQGDRAG